MNHHRGLLAAVFLVASLAASPPTRAQTLPAGPQSDAAPLVDPTRPVTQITRTSFTLQYFTSAPCETRVQVRQGDLPMAAWRPEGKRRDLWATAAARVVSGAPGKRTFHVLKVEAPRPGRRYFYRIYDPGAKPTAREARWGARAPWRREWAVSTQAPKGRKTIVRIPVKVLLMPNVINVASAHDPTGVIAPAPPRMTPAQIARVKEEYAVTSRFFWVNSGMRLWVDFQIQADERWQRWGPEPANAGAFYSGWDVCRSWAGVDFRPPGGGAFTLVDAKNPLRVNKEPVYEERPFAGQVEQAFVRRWNARTRTWEFVGSGGGTLGVDDFGRGVPARSQYLGGSDTAWLACHEVHHQLESFGAFSLADREDDRVVFDHFAPRRRETRPDGTTGENVWNTSGRHGEHWDGIAFWDRTVTDAQWLRMYFGETITVGDADEDGVPDADSALPLDEKRWGSSPRNKATDGRMSDLAKLMLSTWVPAPLQFSLNKPPSQGIRPRPARPDTDGDGLADDADPHPLYPWPPFVWPMRAELDGDAAEWGAVPASGQMRKGGITLVFKQAHDQAGYYGLLSLSGAWRRVRVTLDGEGKGVFSGLGVQGFEVANGDTLTVRPTYGAAGLRWKASPRPGGGLVFEWSLPNRGEGVWYWERGGREVGASFDVAASDGKIYSVYEPYRLFYARMLERSGGAPLPPGAPAELTREAATRVLMPGDRALKRSGTGWKLVDGVLKHGGADESAAYVDGLGAREFDLWVRLEAKQDALLGAFVPGTGTMSAGSDYIAFVGGYANTVTRLRLFGREQGDAAAVLTPGKHTLQLSRKSGGIWCLFDGKPILYAPDPDPKKVIDRLAVLGGYDGDQIIHEVRIRTAP